MYVGMVTKLRIVFFGIAAQNYIIFMNSRKELAECCHFQKLKEYDKACIQFSSCVTYLVYVVSPY